MLRWIAAQWSGSASRGLLGGHRAPIAALGHVTVVAEAGHQRRVGLGGDADVDAGPRRRAGEGVAGKRRGDDVERVPRVAAMGGGVAERADHVLELDDRARPAVGHDQRQRVGLGGAGVDEVEVDVTAAVGVDRGRELRPAVQCRFRRPPVVPVQPVCAQALNGGELGAVVPPRAGDLVRPAGAPQAVAEILQHLIRHVDRERRELQPHRGRRLARRRRPAPTEVSEPSGCWLGRCGRVF